MICSVAQLVCMNALFVLLLKRCESQPILGSAKWSQPIVRFHSEFKGREPICPFFFFAEEKNSFTQNPTLAPINFILLSPDEGL